MEKVLFHLELKVLVQTVSMNMKKCVTMDQGEIKK